jgi:hypothetical protein
MASFARAVALALALFLVSLVISSDISQKGPNTALLPSSQLAERAKRGPISGVENADLSASTQKKEIPDMPAAPPGGSGSILKEGVVINLATRDQ